MSAARELEKVKAHLATVIQQRYDLESQLESDPRLRLDVRKRRHLEDEVEELFQLEQQLRAQQQKQEQLAWVESSERQKKQSVNESLRRGTMEFMGWRTTEVVLMVLTSSLLLPWFLGL